MQKMTNKTTKQVHYSNQGEELNITYISKVGIALQTIYTTKIIARNLHVDNLLGKNKYDIKLGLEMVSK